MRFRTTIHQSGKTTTGIRVPDEIVEALGAGKRPAVRVTIGSAPRERMATLRPRSRRDLARSSTTGVLPVPPTVILPTETTRVPRWCWRIQPLRNRRRRVPTAKR